MSIEVGAKLPGKVSGITNFGAFVDLGKGKIGLVHISEVSNGFVKDINEVLKVGDEVTVLVTAIGEDGKIGLSIRKAIDKPKEEKKEHPEIVQEEREIRENLQNIRKEAKDVEHILEDDIRSQIEKKK